MRSVGKRRAGKSRADRPMRRHGCSATKGFDGVGVDAIMKDQVSPMAASTATFASKGGAGGRGVACAFGRSAVRAEGHRQPGRARVRLSSERHRADRANGLRGGALGADYGARVRRCARS